MNIEAIEQEAHRLGKAGDRLAAIKTIRQALGSLTLAVKWANQHYPKSEEPPAPRNHAREAYARIETRGLIPGRHPAAIENEIARAVNASRTDLAPEIRALAEYALGYAESDIENERDSAQARKLVDMARALLATLP